jgi:hypothetical protein
MMAEERVGRDIVERTVLIDGHHWCCNWMLTDIVGGLMQVNRTDAFLINFARGHQNFI